MAVEKQGILYHKYCRVSMHMIWPYDTAPIVYDIVTWVMQYKTF
jgi:hypothetical protein